MNKIVSNISLDTRSKIEKSTLKIIAGFVWSAWNSGKKTLPSIKQALSLTLELLTQSKVINQSNTCVLKYAKCYMNEVDNAITKTLIEYPDESENITGIKSESSSYKNFGVKMIGEGLLEIENLAKSLLTTTGILDPAKTNVIIYLRKKLSR